MSCDPAKDTCANIWPSFILTRDVEQQYAFNKLHCDPPCQYGTCIGKNTCKCYDGSMDEFCANTPCPGCNNTHGKCLPSATGGYTCTCETGWGGETCNDQDSNSTPQIVMDELKNGTVEYKNGQWVIYTATGLGATVLGVLGQNLYKNWPTSKAKLQGYTELELAGKKCK